MENADQSGPKNLMPSSNIDVEQFTPDVKSFVYQIVFEFEPYTTPETMVTVVAKDPLRLMSSPEFEESEWTEGKLKKMHRIAISLMEADNKIEEEAVHENIFEAIRLAKDKLLKKLQEIHDEVMSTQDRIIQLNTVGKQKVH